MYVLSPPDGGMLRRSRCVHFFFKQKIVAGEFEHQGADRDFGLRSSTKRDLRLCSAFGTMGVFKKLVLGSKTIRTTMVTNYGKLIYSQAKEARCVARLHCALPLRTCCACCRKVVRYQTLT